MNNDKMMMVAVAAVAAIVSYVNYGGPGPAHYNNHAGTQGTPAGVSPYAGPQGPSAPALTPTPVPAPMSAPRALPRMIVDVHACTMDAEHDASGALASGACTVLRTGDQIEVQFWFSENPNVRDDRDLEPCVRAASWPHEAGVRDPRDSRDCVVISRADYEEARR
jgi:hypothetical protein